MTKHNFQELCEKVLVPRIGELLYRQLEPVEATLDAIAQELIRIDASLREVAREVDR
jgi:hypothetical protein